MRVGDDIRCNGPTTEIEENYQSRAGGHKPRIGPSQLVVRARSASASSLVMDMDEISGVLKGHCAMLPPL